MNEKEFQRLLRKIGACAEAVIWARGKTLAEIWQTCERGDWLLWLLGKMVDQPGWVSRQQVVLAACGCAEISLALFGKKYPNDHRPRLAIEAAKRWTRGEATLDEVRRAAEAAYAAAYAAAEVAAYAAADAAAYAAYAAADAVEAVEAAYAARSGTLKECSDIVRREIKLPLLETTEVEK